MADKHFKVKNNVQVSDLTTAGPVTVNASGVLESHTTLAIEKGGTGQTTAGNAINALLPTQLNNTSKILGTDGTNVTWVNPGAAYQTSAPSNPVLGQLWVDSDETGDSLDPYIIRRKTITATAGQTVFTTDVIFTDGYEQIYYNGVLLVRTTDYTTSGGTNTVTLLQGASAGDTVEIISSTPINLVNTLAGNSANTITAQTASSVPLTIEGASSQSASLFNIKNSAGETRYEFLPNGSATFRGTQIDGSSLRIERYTDDLAILGLRSFGGTISSPTAKTNGTRVGMIVADGYDGTTPLNVARITFWVDGPVTTGNVPGAIAFNTVPVGGGAGHIERMRIDSAGRIGIGNSAPIYPLDISYSNSVGGVNETGIRLRNTSTGNSTQINLNGHRSWSMQVEGSFGAPSGGFSLVDNTAGVNRFNIDSSGNIGIGVSAPSSFGKLAISGGGLVALTYGNDIETPIAITANGTGAAYYAGMYSVNQYSGNAATFLTFKSTTTAGTFAERMRLDPSNGYLLVGYTSSNGAYRLQVNSQIFATSSTIATSDGRFKENVDSLSNGLSIIDSLRPVSFTWKDHPVHNFVAGKTVGFIAQEVQEALKDYEWVDNVIKTNYNEETEEEFLGIAEGNLIPLLVSAVKELKADFEEYKRLHP